MNNRKKNERTNEWKDEQTNEFTKAKWSQKSG